MHNLLKTLVLVLWPSLVFAGWPVSGGGSAGGGGDMLAENNLCDVDDAAAALVCIGAQPESEPLTGISALGSTPANRFLYTVGLDTWLDGIITSDGVALLGGSGAANLAFSPAVVTDWDGDSDPGETDDALNQLAERVDDNEAAISAISVPSDVGDLTYTPAVDTDWDGDADPGDADDALDQLAERVDDNEGTLSGLGNLATGDDASDVAFLPNDGDDWPAFPTFVGEGLDLLAGRVAVVEAAITDALQDISDLGVVGAAGKFIYSTGAGTWAFGDITTAGRALLDDASAGDQRATLGLGALATGADAGDVPYTCGVDANWTGSLCPGNAEASFDDLSSRVTTLEGASVDAGDVTFTPTTDGDWTGDTDPGNVDDALDDLAGRVETLEGAGGGGSADSVEKDINQAAHGLAVGDWVRLSGADYIKAQANSAANAEVVGVVSAVSDVDNFTLQRHGHVTGLSGLTAGTLYFLDASTTGAITATEPTGSNVSKPVLQADSTTSGWIIEMRGTIAQATAGWDWAQAVASPAASDWTDASSAGADVSMTAIADGTVGDYVILNPGASTTDQYGVTMAADAGDWVWCARISRMTTNGSSAVTMATAGMDFVLVAAFVDGTDLDNSTWNGGGLIGGAQDWNGSDVGTVSGPGSGSDRWDGALVAGEVQDYMGWSTADVCLERSGTDLVAWIGQRAGGFQRADSWTVSANAGLYAIVLRDVDAAHHHRVRLDAYGLLSAVPGLE